MCLRGIVTQVLAKTWRSWFFLRSPWKPASKEEALEIHLNTIGVMRRHLTNQKDIDI